MIIFDFVSALILTYFGSRLLGRAVSINGHWWRLALIHVACLSVLAILLGYIKSNPYQPFVYGAALPLALPQLLWLGMDSLRLPRPA